MNDPETWIECLKLRPHREGGWYRRCYRSGESVARDCLPDRFDGDRFFSTAIYYLLRDGEVSAFHRIRQDELWHFYDGTSLTVHVIDQAGDYSAIRLGANPDQGERPLGIVRAGCLFGATLNDPESWALAGCTVAPGFTFDDFEMPGRDDLLQRYPQHEGIIRRLTRA